MELNENHFRMKHKMENEWISNFHIDPEQDDIDNKNQQEHNKIESFKFRDYAPHVFQKIRSLSGISDEEYL